MDKEERKFATTFGILGIGGAAGYWWWKNRKKAPAPEPVNPPPAPVYIPPSPAQETILIDIPTLEEFIDYRASAIDVLIQQIRAKNESVFTANVNTNLIPQIAEYENKIATLQSNLSVNSARIPEFDQAIASEKEKVGTANQNYASWSGVKNAMYNGYNSWNNAKARNSELYFARNEVYGIFQGWFADEYYTTLEKYRGFVKYEEYYDKIPVVDAYGKQFNTFEDFVESICFYNLFDPVAYIRKTALNNPIAPQLEKLVTLWSNKHAEAYTNEQNAFVALTNAQEKYQTAIDNKGAFVRDNITPIQAEIAAAMDTLSTLKTSLYTSLTVYQKLLAGGK